MADFLRDETGQEIHGDPEGTHVRYEFPVQQAVGFFLALQQAGDEAVARSETMIDVDTVFAQVALEQGHAPIRYTPLDPAADPRLLRVVRDS